ncbi:MAG: HD domain-containing protein [Clostridiales bacterium]|nr:HD domain-containing protein [Clostridiales bacterium]MBR3841939.1 HD domain-containing protein [Christensenellaceae bacterium]
MNDKLNRLMFKMFEFYENDPNHIQHFIKVHSFARLIGMEEGLSPELLFTLETAAIVHDIGIKPALEQYGSDAGPYQEKLGMPEAEKMLSALDFPREVIDRVVFLVGHHHTYTDIDRIDYRILVEADFLVNMYEGNMKKEAMRAAFEKEFETEAGRKIAQTMFDF